MKAKPIFMPYFCHADVIANPLPLDCDDCLNRHSCNNRGDYSLGCPEWQPDNPKKSKAGMIIHG